MGCGSSTPEEGQLHERRPVKKVAPYPKQAPLDEPDGEVKKPVAPVAPMQQQQAPVEDQQAPAPVQQTPAPVQQAAVAAIAAEQTPTAPPQTQSQPGEEEKTEIEVKEMPITKDLLQKYIELEKQSRIYEKKNIHKKAAAMNNDLQNIEKQIQEMEAQYTKLAEITAKEKQDVDNMQAPNVINYFKENNLSYDSKLSKEQEEYLDALNAQEVAKKELDLLKNNETKMRSDLDSMKEEVKKLDDIYKEQDEMLASIFDGKYGSETENKLEMELDGVMERKQRVSVARYKWSNAKVLLQHSCNQLAFACRKWQSVNSFKPSDTRGRYQAATETRNNLIAASQNIASAQRYLTGITFPYCKPDEVETLNKAVNNIYNDMQSQERHNHALQCYTVTHKRAAALVQWFESVITGTIAKDLNDAKTKENELDKKLRDERLRLIQQKIKEVIGEDVDIDVTDEAESDGDDVDEVTAQLFEPDNVSEAGDLSNGGDEANAEEAGVAIPAGQEGLTPAEGVQGDSMNVTPLPLNELAPPPNNDELFGNIDELKKQHEKDMEEFDKAQEMNKIRMEQGLEEKIKARRSRRQRQAATAQTVQ